MKRSLSFVALLWLATCAPARKHDDTDGISITLSNSDWQDAAECLAFAAGRRRSLPPAERCGLVQRRLDRQLTAARLRDA